MFINDDGFAEVEFDSEITGLPAKRSVVEAFGNKKRMNRDEQKLNFVLSTTGGHIAEGATYPVDPGVRARSTLQAEKFGTVFPITSEELQDTAANTLGALTENWFGNTYPILIDNAVFGTTADYDSSNTDSGVAFQSVYNLLKHDDAKAGYTANSNIIQVSAADLTTGADVLDVLEGALEKAETSTVWNPLSGLVAYEPRWARQLRKAARSANFVYQEAAQNGTLGVGTPGFIFEQQYRAVQSFGLFTSAKNNNQGVVDPDATTKVKGNPLLILCNPEHLFFGQRSSLETKVADENTIGFMNDKNFVKCRTRRGFVPGNPHAFVIVELTA